MEYGQFCPVSKASEVIGERWTLLIMREILFGSRRYSDLQRGLGKISPSVLSQRLQSLCEAGVLRKVRSKGGFEYHPTRSGEELLPVVKLVGSWGQRWVRSKMTKDELDLEHLILDMQRCIVVAKLPRDTVIQLDFPDQPASSRCWWLLATGNSLDLCTQHPGRDANVKIKARVRTMTKVWMGDLPLEEAIRDGSLELEAPLALRKNPRDWLHLSLLADIAPAESDRGGVGAGSVA